MRLSPLGNCVQRLPLLCRSLDKTRIPTSILVSESRFQRRVAKALGVEAEIMPAGWDVMIAGLQANRWDMVTGGLYATPARLEVVNMVTYDINGFCYAVLKSNDKVNTVADLDKSDVTIGTYTGTGTLQAVSKAHPNPRYDTVIQGPGQTLRLDDLLAKRFDVAPFDSPIAAVLEAKYPDVKIIPDGAAGCMKNPDVSTPVGLAIPKDDAVYTEFVSSVIKQMQELRRHARVVQEIHLSGIHEDC